MKYFLTYTGPHKKTVGTFGGEFEKDIEKEVTKTTVEYFKGQKYFKSRVEKPPVTVPKKTARTSKKGE